MSRWMRGRLHLPRDEGTVFTLGTDISDTECVGFLPSAQLGDTSWVCSVIHVNSDAVCVELEAEPQVQGAACPPHTLQVPVTRPGLLNFLPGAVSPGSSPPVLRFDNFPEQLGESRKAPPALPPLFIVKRSVQGQAEEGTHRYVGGARPPAPRAPPTPRCSRPEALGPPGGVSRRRPRIGGPVSVGRGCASLPSLQPLVRRRLSGNPRAPPAPPSPVLRLCRGPAPGVSLACGGHLALRRTQGSGAAVTRDTLQRPGVRFLPCPRDYLWSAGWGALTLRCGVRTRACGRTGAPVRSHLVSPLCGPPCRDTPATPFSGKQAQMPSVQE